MRLECNHEIQELEHFKLLAENNLYSKLFGEYSLIENVSVDKWLFSYKTPSGIVKHHFIKSLWLGKSKVYKNGGMVMASSLESLIKVLTNGLIQVSGIQRKVA